MAKIIGKIIGLLLRIGVGWVIPLFIFVILNFVLEISYLFHKIFSLIILCIFSSLFLYYYSVKNYQIQFYLFLIITLILVVFFLLDIIFGNNLFIYVLILLNILFTIIVLVPGLIYEQYRRFVKIIFLTQIFVQLIILYMLKTGLPFYNFLLAFLLILFALMNLITTLRPFEERNLQRKVAFVSILIALIIIFYPVLTNFLNNSILQNNFLSKLIYIKIISNIEKEYQIQRIKDKIILQELYDDIKEAYKIRYKNFVETLPFLPLTQEEKEKLGIK
jgi:hypothetical protein